MTDLSLVRLYSRIRRMPKIDVTTLLSAAMVKERFFSCSDGRCVKT